MSNRTVVVSGGTGALGRALVDAFLDSRDRVVVPWISALEQENLAETHAGAVAAGHLVLVEADVADAAGSELTALRAGPVDVLVNGVGGFAEVAPFVETALEVWDRMYRINVRSAVALTRVILPAMIEHRQGVVVNVGAQGALARSPGLAAYSAAKNAVLVLTDSLHQEVASLGIRVNAILPSTIDTPANRRARPDADYATWTPPEAIAGVVRWLASDDARSVRGAHIPV